jgi:hypothetical protein
MTLLLFLARFAAQSLKSVSDASDPMLNCTEVDLAQSLPRLRQRFPGFVVDSKFTAKARGEDLVRALATSQGISMTEAREEMRDFLYLESLRAELSLTR